MRRRAGQARPSRASTGQLAAGTAAKLGKDPGAPLAGRRQGWCSAVQRGAAWPQAAQTEQGWDERAVGRSGFEVRLGLVDVVRWVSTEIRWRALRRIPSDSELGKSGPPGQREKRLTISNKLHLPCRISRAVRCTEVRCVVGETHKPEETASSDGMLTGREKQVGLDGLGVPTQAREIREKSRLNQACRKSRLTWMGVPGWAE